MPVKEIVFPAGVNRRLSFRQQTGKRDRYFAPYSMNVRAEDFTGRLRGGSWSPSPAANVVGSGVGIDVVGSTPVEYIAVRHSGGSQNIELINTFASSTSLAQCIYRDRLIRPENKIIYASRLGNYADWSLSTDLSDSTRPFVIQLSEAGEIGGDVVALIPHKDSYLLAFTNSSSWVIQGDPTDNGGMRNISREIGIVGPKAWCRDHLDRYYFLSSHGLYTVSASGDGMQAISEDVIPEELTGVTDDDTVLEYDHETRGVYIHIPGVVSWLFDTERQGFWPFKVGYSGSHVAIGPFSMSDGNTFGRLIQLHGIVANGSVSVTWRVLVADTAEQVCINAKLAIDALIAGTQPADVHSTGIWPAGVNHRTYPRARGKYMILLVSAANGNWAWEGASAVMTNSGAWR